MTTHRITTSRQITIPNLRWVDSFRSHPHAGPNIVLFTGGSGARGLAMTLADFTHNSTHITNTTDSGGSTQPIRERIQGPATGDIRSRLVDLADKKTPGYHEVTELLKYRLPTGKSSAELANELESIINGSHRLAQNIPVEVSEFSTIIRSAINIFYEAIVKFQHDHEQYPYARFPLAGGSIGNFYLTGEYLHYNRDLETAIFLYSSLAGVRGKVIPTTLGNHHLWARFADGRTIYGQHLFTGKEQISGHASNASPIAEIGFCDLKYDLRSGKIRKIKTVGVRPILNPKVGQALSGAEAIVYTMGSFYSSIISSLMIPGIGKLIRQSRAPKILIANPTYDIESFGMTAALMAKTLIKYLRLSDSSNGRNSDYLNWVVFHDRPTRAEHLVPLQRSNFPIGVQPMTFPILDAEDKYDPLCLSEIILSFAQ